MKIRMLLIAGSLVASTGVNAQDPITTLFPAGGVEFVDAAGVGDVDRDGVDDFAVGDTSNQVVLYSGATLTVIWSVPKPVGLDRFGSPILRMGDVNADGLPDVGIGGMTNVSDGNGQSMRVYDGATGQLLVKLYGSRQDKTVVCGDVDADGAADLLTGGVFYSWIAGPVGTYTIWSGRTGAVLHSFASPWDPGFADSVATVGDVNGDGFADFLVTHSLQNLVWIFSGKDGSKLQTVLGPPTALSFGALAEGIGDVDGDEVADYVVSSSDPSAVLDTYSGATGTPIRRIAFDSKHRVASLDHLGDVNGDGLGDFAVNLSDLHHTYSHMEIYSGGTSNRLHRFSGLDWPLVRDAGLVDTDAIGDLTILQRAGSRSGTRSRVELRSGNDLWLDVWPRDPAAGVRLELTLSEGTASQLTLICLVAFAGSPISNPLAPVLAFPASGSQVVSFTVPPGLSGVNAVFQAWATSPAGVLNSAQVEVLVQ